LRFRYTITSRTTAAGHSTAAALGLAAIILTTTLSVRTLSYGPTQDAPKQSDTSGKSLYEAACMSCHGPDGRGAPQSVVGFNLELPDFTDCSFSTPEPDVDWLGIIQHGGPLRGFDRKMPAFGDALSTEEINRIITYLRGFCTSQAWPRGDLNLPRPLRTEKAFPENEALVTTTFEGSGPDTIGSVFVYEHRIGPRTQYELVVPFNLQKADAAGWQRGIGDVAVAVKHVMFHSLERGSIVSGGGEVTFPTGKEDLGLGGGLTIFEPFVAYGQILPRDGFLHAQAGLEFPKGRPDANNEAFWRTAIGWSVTQNGGTGRTWSPMLELVGARDFAKGERARWDIVPQVQITLNKRGHIMLNGGIQIPVNERNGRGKKVMVYLLWDWFDGGFLSGW
jgi:mono/diheme cytochrome c family protein